MYSLLLVVVGLIIPLMTFSMICTFTREFGSYSIDLHRRLGDRNFAILAVICGALLITSSLIIKVSTNQSFIDEIPYYFLIGLIIIYFSDMLIFLRKRYSTIILDEKQLKKMAEIKPIMTTVLNLLGGVILALILYMSKLAFKTHHLIDFTFLLITGLSFFIWRLVDAFPDEYFKEIINKLKGKKSTVNSGT